MTADDHGTIAWPTELTEDEAREHLKAWAAANDVEPETFDRPLTLVFTPAVTLTMRKMTESIARDREEWAGATVSGTAITKEQAPDPPRDAPEVMTDHQLDFYVESSVKIRDCPHCNGTRRIRHDGCDGKGYFECKRTVDCDACDGKGKTGSGQCEACSGKGHQKCEVCDGTGRRNCRECSGAGKLPCGDCNEEGAFTSAYMVRATRRVHPKIVYEGFDRRRVAHLDPIILKAPGTGVPAGLPEDHHTAVTKMLEPIEHEIGRELEVAVVPVTQVRFQGKNKMSPYFIKGREHEVSGGPSTDGGIGGALKKFGKSLGL